MDKVKVIEDKNTILQKKKREKELKQERRLQITHYYGHDKYLNSIEKLNGYTNLTVLYLHNNNIEKIENLKGLKNLVALYLQKNKIKKLENLDKLPRLQRLYLGHNEISVVENLENLQSLTELHIEKQNFPKGSCLCFDPRTLMYLKSSLQILNISNNNIPTIEHLRCLFFLKTLIASNNNITDIKHITNPLTYMINLREADFNGNPVTKERKYRESIICCSKLTCLDGKDVSDITRNFIRRLEEEKFYGNRSKGELIEGVEEFGKRYSLGMQKSVCNLMLKPVNKGEGILNGCVENGAYLAWKSLPNSFKTKHKK